MRDQALALGLVKKGRGRSESIALAEGIESSSRYQTPAVPVSKSRCTAKAETSAIDFKACQQGTFANGCAKKIFPTDGMQHAFHGLLSVYRVHTVNETFHRITSSISFGNCSRFVRCFAMLRALS